MMAQLMPNMQSSHASNNRKSPLLRAEINSIKFDLGDDDPQKPLNTEKNSSRRGCRSVLRGNAKVNDARSITSGGSIVPVSRASKLRHDLNVSTPSSLAMGYRQNQPQQHYNRSISEYDAENAANLSHYQNLQAKIDKNRKYNTIENTPPVKRFSKTKIIADTPSTKDNFTDISKVKPNKLELEPIPTKKNINFAPYQNMPVQSDRDKQMLLMNTNAFLYSKIPDPGNKKSHKKSNIMNNDSGVADYGPMGTKSQRVTSNNKSIVSSLIATLGQRKRETKSVNNNPFLIKSKPQHNETNNRLNQSPKIATEKVWFTLSNSC